MTNSTDHFGYYLGGSSKTRPRAISSPASAKRQSLFVARISVFIPWSLMIPHFVSLWRPIYLNVGSLLSVQARLKLGRDGRTSHRQKLDAGEKIMPEKY